MSKLQLQGHASGSGTLTIGAPNTDSNRTITLPDATGTLLTSDGSASSLTAIPAANITGTLPAIDGSNLTGAGVTTLNTVTNITVSASDPTASTNPSAIGYLWINKTLGKLYVATDVSAGANIWKSVGEGTGHIT